MDYLEYLLTPVIWLMEVVLVAYYRFTGSIGLSILLLSFTFSLLLLPIQRKGRKIEEKLNEKIRIIDTEVRQIKGKFKGEQLFIETEKIYNKYSYHPIKSIATATSFLVMLPILISAILLLYDNSMLDYKSFLFINDLSEPDEIINSINFLPLLMFAVTLVDANLRYKGNIQVQLRFLLLALILLVLVYNMPAGLVLYWIGSNVFSLITNNTM